MKPIELLLNRAQVTLMKMYLLHCLFPLYKVVKLGYLSLAYSKLRASLQKSGVGLSYNYLMT